MLKSRVDRYGTVAVSIHWVSAILILVLLGTGFRAANVIDATSKAGILRLHIPIAIAVLLLTLVRIAWWWRFDRKPLPWTDRRYGRSGSPAQSTLPFTSSSSV
ncbi:cytochrome b/b6 domain-containing protein [Rhizobium sp. BR 317]|uniref:cytochrome b n=1 Tax=Rhizobium sp. BR 317 TaxID=3040015 RepID=UPI0039BFB14F